ncbi:maleylacetate reductase [Pseudonocardia kujensis]|uniref:maleylacetate reductase n=1 Tax=Pseudonocardia kujensis TaxID=1128675 RepID=UPI001E4F8419|nr:maleylacetate reductase [Pseudonocardia kujensis]MCE0767736.1 maleylacetate reductase [Pseudonocardia kujensis]
MDFVHTTLGQRVLFGSGKAAIHVAGEVRRLSAGRIMVVASSRHEHLAETVCRNLDVAHWFDQVVQHVPVETVAAARAAAADHGVDLLLSVGGGSAVGLAKAIALTTGLPIIAVPTTYAGSEATNVWGTAAQRTKTTGVDDRVLPASVVYDATLTLSLPAGLSVASGLNSLAHCIDSLWAPNADPINLALALEGARALTQALPRITRDPQSLEAREHALYACYLAAVAFGSAGSGLHHKICHVLGGMYNLPHAETHATVLPHVLAFNAPAVPELAARLAASLGRPAVAGDEPAESAVAALGSFRDAVDAPRRLADYGFSATDIPDAVDRIRQVAPPSNPRPVTADSLTALLTNALTGTAPAPHSRLGSRLN